MNDADDEAFGAWTKKVPFQDRTPKLAWQAACEWRDSQDRTAQINHQLVEALELAETEMRYAGWGTPVADNSGLANAYEAVVAALAATQMKGDA